MRNQLYFGIFILLLIIVLYLPIFPSLWDLLLDDNNSHGLFVPFISGVLIWQKRQQISKTGVSVSKFGLIVLLFSLLLYYLGEIGLVEILPRLAFILTIIGIVLYNYGMEIFRLIWFPLGFLFFLIPVPVSIIDTVSLPLKMIATILSAKIIALFNIPVYREGNLLFFSTTQLEVANACSGIRSMISYFMLTTLFAYLMKSTPTRKIVLISLALPLAFLSNLLRVTGTGFLAHFFGPVVARGFLHEISGFVTFAFGFIVIFFITRLLETPNTQGQL